MKLNVFAAGLAASTFLAGGAQAGVLYAIDNQGDQIITIDPTTGATSVHASLASGNYSGLALDGAGNFIASNNNPFGPEGSIVTFDGTTGATLNSVASTPAGSGESFGFVGLEFASDGTLFGNLGQSIDDLATIDPVTGEYTTVISVGAPGPSGGFIGLIEIAIDSNDVIYSYDTLTQSFLTVDPVLGVSVISTGAYSASFESALVFGDNDVLYMVTTGFTDELITIDPTTGAVINTLVLGDGSLNLTGLAFAKSDGGDPDPEPPVETPVPASIWFLAVGAAGIAGAARRRGR